MQAARLFALLAVAAAGAIGAHAGEAVGDPEALAQGRTFTAWFYAGEVGRLWERFSPDMRKAMTREQLAGFQKKVSAEAGAETALAREVGMHLDGLQSYRRTAAFEKAASVEVLWTFESSAPGGQAGRAAAPMITAFYVRPPAPPAASRFLGYETKTRLRLPFEGEWLVFWGGRSVAENYHASTPDQRFGYDFLVAKGGRTFEGDGSRNAQYHAFGLRVLAPGSGRVVVAVDGVDDNRPGEQNAARPLGNHVILDHGQSELSFFAHLKKGSVRVKRGARVKSGQELGRCGNSGNSSQVHLHYHLQTTAVFGWGREGEGLPAWFEDYLADGQPVARGEPTRGQRVRPRGP